MRKLLVLPLLFCFYISHAQPQLVGALRFSGSQHGGGIFRLNLPGTGPGILHHFNNLNPHRPVGGLTAANDDWLYGMISYDGTGLTRALYKIRRNGTGFTIVNSLSDLSEPVIPYLHSDGMIYFGNGFELRKLDTSTHAMTSIPLSNQLIIRNLLIDQADNIFFMTGSNTIASIQTNGTMETTLYTFNPLTEGNLGRPGLTEAPGDTLFGLMVFGGASDGGTLFSIKKDGTGFAIHHHFTAATGIYPESKLVYFDGKLFGTTSQGGDFNNGVLFSIRADGSDYTVLHHFEAGMFSTGATVGNISITSNGRIFGTYSQFFYDPSFFTYRMYKVDTSGQNFERIISSLASNQRAIGHFNLDPLVVDNGETIFFPTQEMGRFEGGVFNQFDTSGSGLGLYHFGYSATGFRPVAGLIKGSDGKLYGTAFIGGTTGNGLVFSIHADGTSYTKLHEFSDAEGWNLSGKLLEASDGKLYGVCKSTSSSNGSIYRLDKDGSNFQVIHYFSDPSFGYEALGSLIEVDGMLFGTAAFSFPGNGVLFRINKNGSNYTVLKEFNVSGLYRPADGVIAAGNYLYGHCGSGGAENKGGVYRIRKDGTGYQELHVFNGATDGFMPVGIPVMANNGRVYGVTSSGGDNNFGIIYGIDSNGANYTMLRSFINTTDGAYPTSLIQASDGLLYGGTSFGIPGSGTGGTIFRLAPDGSGFNVVKAFDSQTEGDAVTGLLDLAPNLVLPVQLTSFSAQKINASVRLSWQTSQEYNSNRFDVERSLDGANFVFIGSVQAAGTTNAPRHYGFTDHRPVSGMNYYRLKQIDLDGRINYSQVVPVKFGERQVVLVPNPVSGQLHVRLYAEGFTSLAIVDATGRTVMQKNITPSANSLQINVHHLPKGWYMLKLTGSSMERQEPFIKK